MLKKKGQKLLWMLKSLMASYIVTGLLLLGLTVLVYKFELDEQLVVGSIVVIYVLATFLGGFIIGKLTGHKKYIWGLMTGAIYFGLLYLISYGVYREFSTNGLNAVTTAILCVGGGMLGGMVS